MSLAQLQREVNAIKRKLVHELRVVRARRAAAWYCNLWEELVVVHETLPPAPQRLLQKLLKNTGGPGFFARPFDYLNA